MNPDKNNKTDATIRCFIAIVLDEQLKRQLCRIQTAIRSSGIDAKWPSAQNFHLTLKFLGNISEQTIPCIKAVLSETISNKAPFNISFDRLGVFPNAQYPKVIWIGSEKTSPELVTLQRDIDSRLNRCHPFVKEKNFSPHITLSRIRNRINPDILKKALEIETGYISIPVTQIHLVKSRLYSSGAVHSSLFCGNLK